jgi:predicted Fe-S protein YdhL (DUF1289 family)
MDAASGLCTGCGRALHEIASWGSMSDAERSAIMRTLPKRLAAAGLQKPNARHDEMT